MKLLSKFFFLPILLSCQLNVFANKPVNAILGGSFNVSYSKEEGETEESFSAGVLPNVGILIHNRLELGAGFGRSYSREPLSYYDNNYNYRSYHVKEKSKSLHFYIRDNFFRREKLSVFYGVYFNRSTGFTEPEIDNSVRFDTKSLGIGINSGLNYALSEKIELTTSFGVLNFSKDETIPEGYESTVNKNVSFLIDFNTIYLGIRFVL